VPNETVESVLQKHSNRLRAITGVVGFAEGEFEGKPCIKVYVNRKTPELVNQIPPNLEGYIVCVEETGNFQAFHQL